MTAPGRRWQASALRTLAFLVATACLSAPAAAQEVRPAAREVYTQGVIASTFREAEAPGLYIAIRLRLPGGPYPFTTVSYRVRDPQMIAGLPEGTRVAFQARHIAGENVLTAIRRAP